MRRSLTIEGAPDGTVPAGATDASRSVPAAGKFRGASGRGLPGSVLARASRLLGRGGRKSSGSAAGKPNASAQAGRVKPKPGLFMPNFNLSK